MGSLISFSVSICYIMFYLLYNGGLTHSRTQSQSSNCATSCGHLHDIHHPFRLKTDPAHCGSTYFEITCDTGKPYLEWSSGKYYIIDISYFYQTINVVDPVYMDQNSCKLPNYPFEDANPDYYFFNGISICESSQNAASFLSCTKQIQNSKYISCTGGNDSFIYVLMDGVWVTDLEPSCRYLNSTFISDVELKSKTTRDAYVVLRGGFQLCWFRKSLSMLLGRCLKASSRNLMEKFLKRKQPHDGSSSSTSQVPKRAQINPKDYPTDPAKRPKIFEYHPYERDEVRRIYLNRGPNTAILRRFQNMRPRRVQLDDEDCS